MTYTQMMIRREPVSAGVEMAAKWVQWAMHGVTAGAVANDATIRYNLDQFWREKAKIYSAESAEARQQLESLDAVAHGVWAALESGKVVSNPSNFFPWMAGKITGQAATREGANQAAGNVILAAKGMETRSAAGSGALVSYARQIQANAAAEKEKADKWWDKGGPLGIPLWGWAAAGAAVLVGIMSMRRGR